MLPCSKFFCPKFCLIFLAAAFLSPAIASAADWQQPTPEELTMKTQAQAPNASAVYLFREETTDDKLHMHSIYVRLKVLMEEGKKYADVEIPYEHRRFSITDVAGRTIHADGSVVPFTGKPYDKVISKTSTAQYQRKVFSMPDVQAGSIIEYRYKLRYDDDYAVPPTWFIQSELYLRKAHYRFVPTEHELTSGRDQVVSSLIWLPMLPKGDVVRKEHDAYVLDVENIPAQPDEEYLPPFHSYTYRVYFNYSPYRTGDEFWKNEGKYWSKQLDKFMNVNGPVSAMASQLTSPGDPQDVKVKKLYAGVEALENTAFTREHSTQEDKSQGLRGVRTVQDIIARKRGSSDELTMLFVALARAAGLKAYVMGVSSRDAELFNPNLLSMGQLDDYVAIVNVNGKEMYFDPGERYCAFGQLHWKHTMTRGLRQTDGGTGFGETPDNPYTDSKTVQIATLKMSEDGQVNGTVKVGYTGTPALYWRQHALETDQKEIEHDMEEAMRKQLPGGMTVKLDKIFYLDDPTKQLIANYTVNGPLATVTSKRMFVPLEIFEVNARPKFAQPKREMPVYFHYAYENADEINITFPPSISVESAPKNEKIPMKSFAALVEGAEVKDNTLKLARSFAIGTVIFPADEYDDLRTFYARVIRKDQEQAVLKVGAHASGN